MALFGKSDDSVPALTAFYQAVADKNHIAGGEIDVLVHRYAEHNPHTLTPWSIKEGIKNAEFYLREVVEHHPLIVSMMDKAADALPFEVDEVDTLNELLSNRLGPPHLLVRTWPMTAAAEVVYPTVIGTYEDGWQVRSFFGSVLREFVTSYEDKSFTRCSECRNVFPARRADQKFCSHRCADREGTRKRRAAKKTLNQNNGNYLSVSLQN